MTNKLYISVLHWLEVGGDMLGYISDNREMVAFYSQWWQEGEQEQGNSAEWDMYIIPNTFSEDTLNHLRKLACDVHCSPEIHIQVEEEGSNNILIPRAVYDMKTGWTAEYV